MVIINSTTILTLQVLLGFQERIPLDQRTPPPLFSPAYGSVLYTCSPMCVFVISLINMNVI